MTTNQLNILCDVIKLKKWSRIELLFDYYKIDYRIIGDERGSYIITHDMKPDRLNIVLYTDLIVAADLG